MKFPRKPETEKRGSSKLETELRLFCALYLNAVRTESEPRADEDGDPGVPLRDIRRFTDRSRRTLSRYLRELCDIGAIRRVCVHTVGQELYYRAEVPPDYLEERYDSAFRVRYDPQGRKDPSDAHLLHLERTVCLMRKYLEGDDIPAYCSESSCASRFFQSRAAARFWYENQFYDSLGDGEAAQIRMIQRDAKTVWSVLSGTEQGFIQSAISGQS